MSGLAGPLDSCCRFCWVAVLALLLVRHSRRWIEETAYAVTPNAIVFRSGWWGKRLSVVGFNKIQAVVVESDTRSTGAIAWPRSESTPPARAGRVIESTFPYLDEVVAADSPEKPPGRAGRSLGIPLVMREKRGQKRRKGTDLFSGGVSRLKSTPMLVGK